MEITLFKNGSMTNTIEKKLTDPLKIENVYLKEECSVDAPTIVLEHFEDMLMGYNYAQIPDFGRYYFMSAPPTIIDGYRVEISLRRDVLMSFKADILKSTAIIERSTSKSNYMISDTVTPPWTGGRYTYKRFSKSEFETPSATSNSFVLITLGGAINE